MTLKVAEARPYAKLLSVGGYRSSRVVSNEEMCTIIESNDEWIRDRTGIIERRWATENETPLFMATEAAKKAIERAEIDLAEIDGLIVSTVSHFRQFPSLAVYLSAQLGLNAPVAYDICAGCAGFCYMVGQADALVRSGNCKNVLIVGVETLTAQTNFEDRGTAFLFGDGAGAAIIGPSDTPAISPTLWGSDGSQACVIEADNWSQAWDENGAKPKIRMAGNKVYRWATTFIAEQASKILAASGLAPNQLDVFIPHQANNRITDSMLRRLKLPESVVVSRDIKHTGNTSAASVPLAMEALLESGVAKSGQTALLIGYGAGLAYAGQVVVLP